MLPGYYKMLACWVCLETFMEKLWLFLKNTRKMDYSQNLHISCVYKKERKFFGVCFMTLLLGYLSCLFVFRFIDCFGIFKEMLFGFEQGLDYGLYVHSKHRTPVRFLVNSKSLNTGLMFIIG